MRFLHRAMTTFVLIAVLMLPLPGINSRAAAITDQIQTPEQFFGFRMGTDKKLARWDKIVEYFKHVAASSDRVRFRELGKSTNNNPFVLLEIASPETLKNLDHFKQLERKLYFQGGAPTDAERDEIFRMGKAVVFVTCNVHATEIGSSQMVSELVHRLATENSSLVKKILDNTIFLLVPSLNPDGQIIVTDWYNKNLGTEFENSPLPWLYHPYVGHDNNRDMYMFTQKESQLTAQVLWHEWFPSVWLDEHQQGNGGARIFVMPATDPINPNVHPLIYRMNGIFGQSQGAALEAEGKEGIIYNSTYTNFWEGAHAWSGWWHNQVGLLTEVASVNIATSTEQARAQLGRPPDPVPDAGEGRRGGGGGPGNQGGILPAPRDVMPRTEYPRPWLGGKWTLRDIVDYELIATMALLETAADQREQLLRHIYAVNKATLDAGTKGEPSAIIINAQAQHDPRAALRLIDRLQFGGVEVSRAETEFEADGKKYPAGTFVIPMTQVFARYAKDMLEKQTYPEVRRSPTSPPEPPYDVTAWSLGMLMGVDTVFVRRPLPQDVRLTKLTAMPKLSGAVSGTGNTFVFDYKGGDSAIALNRLFKDGAQIAFESRKTSGQAASQVYVSGISSQKMEALARELDFSARAVDSKPASLTSVRAPRIGLYQSWTASMDEGWTRWVLENFEFPYKTLHNADIKAGKLREKFDVIILADQSPNDILNGNGGNRVRPEYRGGIGDEGLDAVRAFLREGGTVVAMGNSGDLMIEKFPLPVRNLKRGLTREQHFAPGSILRIEVDQAHPIGFGMPASTYGFYNNSPFYSLVEGFDSHRASVIVRYPNTGVLASGWLKGDELMAGRAAVVAIDMKPGRIILFGLRPQHRAQTHATFPLLFNSLYWAATSNGQM